MRLPDSGSLKEEHYTFWQGKGVEETREHGIGFVIRSTLLPIVEPSTDDTRRILTLHLSTSAAFSNLMCIFAPALLATPKVKDQFYDQLDATVSRIPTSEHVYLFRDFNTWVGADRESWPRVSCHYSIAKLNENGQRLLELCCFRNLCVTNTYFQNKAHHNAS